MALDLAPPPRRRLSMTSLTDVIFLLLLFFMLSSTFSKFGEIDLSGAAPSQASGGEGQMLFLSLGMESLSLNGQQADLHKIADLITLQPRQAGSRQVALVHLEQQTTAQRLVDLLSSLRAVPGLAVVVLE